MAWANAAAVSVFHFGGAPGRSEKWKPWFASTMSSRSAPTASRCPLDHGYVVAPVVVVGAELDGPKTHLLQFEQVVGALVRRPEFGSGSVCLEPGPGSAQQPVHGFAVHLAGDVPQRRFEPGQTDAERLSGVEHAAEAVDVERVPAEDEVAQGIAEAGVKATHGHSRRFADDALVGRHADEGQLVVRLSDAGLRGNVQRRRQGRRDAVQLEPVDPQGGGLSSLPPEAPSPKSTVSKSSWLGTLGA